MSSDSPDADTFTLADHVLAISETSSPEAVCADILGEHQDLDSVAERFVEQGISLRAEDFFEDTNTRHKLRFGDRIEFAPCVVDALIAAELVPHALVTIRSQDAVSGNPVIFEVTDEHVDVTPTGAVISLGLGEAVVESGDLTQFAVESLGGAGAPCIEDIQDVGCAYINAFTSLEHYEQWAAEAEAKTVALPAERLIPEIRRFAAKPSFLSAT